MDFKKFVKKQNNKFYLNLGNCFIKKKINYHKSETLFN